MMEIFNYTFSAISLGATFAILPSALLALMINETLNYGKSAGVKVAIIPAITDLPLLIIAVFILSFFSKMNIFLALISFSGASYLIYLGAKGIFFSKGINLDKAEAKPDSLKKGLITNLLNPNMYIFWFTVGTPVVIKDFHIKPILPIFFIIAYLFVLIGIRIVMVFLINSFKSFVRSTGYLILSKVLSVALIAFAVKLIFQGISLWKF